MGDFWSSGGGGGGITGRNEVNEEDENAPEEERGRLAEVPAAVLEQQQGDYVGRHLDHGRQEAAQVRVAVHAGGVEHQRVVPHVHHYPAETKRQLERAP